MHPWEKGSPCRLVMLQVHLNTTFATFRVTNKCAAHATATAPGNSNWSAAKKKIKTNKPESSDHLPHCDTPIANTPSFALICILSQCTLHFMHALLLTNLLDIWGYLDLFFLWKHFLIKVLVNNGTYHSFTLPAPKLHTLALFAVSYRPGVLCVSPLSICLLVTYTQESITDTLNRGSKILSALTVSLLSYSVNLTQF